MSSATFPLNLSLRAGHPDFLDLPWNLPFSEWERHTSRIEEMPRGLSRHPVIFLNYSGVIYALKELPAGLAEREYHSLLKIEELRLPAVTPVGHVATQMGSGLSSVLITRFLEHSIPYRSLFQHSSLETYRKHLLDAISGLLVQIHLAGVYWGDCSLSNTLFRRDAGALRAYLVDAETAELYSDRVPPALRLQDLVVMEENVNGELAELDSGSVPLDHEREIYPQETGAYIRLRYQQLWEEITREELIHPWENYRIQERINALNELGFSVGEIDIQGQGGDNRLRMRVMVTDRNFHRDQLLGLTGLEAEEMQARMMMNEIQQVKANLSQSNNRSTPLGTAAFHWLENLYLPVIRQLEPLLGPNADPAELYCQVLEHKWYLSERAQQDVGHQAAAVDFIKHFGNN